jgi:hypothetical protein
VGLYSRAHIPSNMLHTTPPPHIVGCLASPEALDLIMLDPNYDTGGVVSSIFLGQFLVPEMGTLDPFFQVQQENMEPTHTYWQFRSGVEE